MNLNDFFSKPSRIKEAYTNNYPSSNPSAATADVSSDSDSDPKFDRLGKKDMEPEIDFRKGLVGDDSEFFEPDVRIGKPVEPNAADTDAFMSAVDSYGEQNPYMQSWGGKYATGGSSQPQWRYVEKGEDPARYGSDTISGTGTPDWRSIAAAGKPAAASGLPKMRFDRATNSLVPVDQPVALDLSPKNSNIKSGSNSNIDADTRARALAWAARKNAVGGIRAQDVGPDNSAPATVKPVAAPALVKPAVVPPAASLKDLPVEKPSSWKDIAQANNISNPNRIMPGQVLKIPGKADYTVQPGDTLADIASGKIKAPKTTPTAGDTQPAAAAVLKKYPNVGTLAPIPRDVMKDLGMDAQTKKEIAKNGREELLTPAIIQQQKKADADIAAIDKKMRDRAAANRKKTNEDDIDEQTVPADIKYSGMNRTMGSAIATHSAQEKNGKSTNSFNTTSMFHDPANPNDNSYMDRSSTTTDGKEENSTRYATNVTPAWMKNLKSTAGITTEPAAQPPSQYPTQVGQGMNNKPFAAYSTPPGQLEINRESLDRMRSLAGIRKK